MLVFLFGYLSLFRVFQFRLWRLKDIGRREFVQFVFYGFYLYILCFSSVIAITLGSFLFIVIFPVDHIEVVLQILFGSGCYYNVASKTAIRVLFFQSFCILYAYI